MHYYREYSKELLLVVIYRTNDYFRGDLIFDIFAILEGTRNLATVKFSCFINLNLMVRTT